MSFLYKVGQSVKVDVNGVSGVLGIITGRAEYADSVNQYVISYDNGNSSDWFSEADVST